MNLIEVGSTKLQLYTQNGEELLVQEGPGFNPLRQKIVLLKDILGDLMIGSGNIYYFGTGLLGENEKKWIRDALIEWYPHREIYVGNDLEGTCLALCGEQSGVCSILGTGSATAFWNGHAMSHKLPSLGPWLGDEGSGFSMGSALLKAYFRNNLSENVHSLFRDGFDPEGDLLARIYQHPEPVKFIASFCAWAGKNQHYEEVRELIYMELKLYIAMVKDWMTKNKIQQSPIGFSGSVAWHFRSILHEIAGEQSLNLGNIIQFPGPVLFKWLDKIK